MLKELIDYSIAAGGDLPEEEPECVLVCLSSKLGKSEANALAKILGRQCPELNVEVRRHHKSHNYVLEVRPIDDESTSQTTAETKEDSADRLLQIRKKLEECTTDRDEQLQYVQDGQKTIVLDIPVGTRIISFLQSKSPRLIRYLTPLHQLAQLGHLQLNWVFATPWELLSPPIGQIRAYFGPEIALYFAWLAHFTGWLIWPALIGTWLFLKQFSADKGSSEFVPFLLFALFNAGWAIAFLRSWESRQQEFTGKWAKGKEEDVLKRDRAPAQSLLEQFLGFNPSIVGQFLADPKGFLALRQLRPHFWRPFDQFSLLSLLFVLLGLLRLQDWAKLEYGQGWLTRTSVVLQALVCIGAEWFYRRLVSTDSMEMSGSSGDGERDEEEEETGLIARLALFQSISAFCPLFYIAFWMGDWERLQETLATLLITRQFVQNFTEIGIPLAMGQLRQFQLAFIGSRLLRAKRRGGPLLRDESMVSIGGRESASGERQMALSEYGRPLDDYLEMFVQLGYVLLFSPAFPPAALCALLNNLLEARVDAFKLCAVHRRPWPRSAQAGIGGWQIAIKMMCLASVWVNLALVLLRCFTNGG